MASCVNHTPVVDVGQGGHNASLSGVINQVILPAVCAFGIVGNVLNLAILTRRKLKKSIRTLEQAANLCLIYLATSDLLFCVFAFSTTFLPVNNIYDHHGLTLHYALYSVGIINVFIMESTMLTVAMSLERYLAICFPLRQDIYLTTRRIKFVIPFTFLFSVGFNIPVFMRYEIVTLCVSSTDDAIASTNGALYNLTSIVADFREDLNSKVLHDEDAMISVPNATQVLANAVSTASFNSGTNLTRKSASVLILPSSLTSTHLSLLHALSPLPQTSSSFYSESDFSFSGTVTSNLDIRKVYTTKIVSLGGNHVYDIAYRIVWAFVGNFIPLLLLLFFNICLCRKIYRSYKQRKQLGRQVQTRSSSHILTMTLVAIVVLFLILVAPSEVTLQISHLTSSHDTPMYRDIEAVLNLMQSINFSVNFILYCIISPYFRKTLKYMVLCGCYNVYHVSRHSKQDFHTSLL